MNENILFNRDGRGSEEIVAAVGMISDAVDFSKWEPVIPLAQRQVKAVIGPDAFRAIVNLYHNPGLLREGEAEAVEMAQRAVAFFTWLRVIPTIDAQHGAAGRQHRLGENEKGLTALQEFKDEENIRTLAFESLEALVEIMDRCLFDWWTASFQYAQRSGLLIRDKETFDRFYHIGSHRMYLTLEPIIREVQHNTITPIIGAERMKLLIDGDAELCASMLEECQRVTALLSIKKAVQRLPVELIPEGVVQVQQTGTVKEKLKAERDARRETANALQEDADDYIRELQDIVARMDTPPDAEDTDYHVAEALLHSKGISF